MPAAFVGADLAESGIWAHCDSEPPMGWEPLGQVAPRELRGAREQAHWAAQVSAVVGATVCSHAPSTSHTGMAREPTRVELVGAARPREQEIRIALRNQDFQPCLLGTALSRQLGRPASNSEIDLQGRSLAEAYRWA